MRRESKTGSAWSTDLGRDLKCSAVVRQLVLREGVAAARRWEVIKPCDVVYCWK